jgi:uncharacterized 2Fe-2S/4Fe-4S cluster protein (DUF4445 family)
MTGSQRHRVIFQPMGVRAEAEDGQTLRDVARANGVAIDSICGERATCGKCKVIVQRGTFHKAHLTSDDDHLSPPDATETAYWAKRAAGLAAQGEDPTAYRLSCQAEVRGDVIVMVPASSRATRQVVAKAAGDRAIDVKPIQRKIYVELEPATLANPLADWERVKNVLIAADDLTRGPADQPLDAERLRIDLPALRGLQRAVRDGDWTLTATIRDGQEVIRVEPGYDETLVGLAVDIGSTTVVAHLCDLRTGEVLATADMMNPQTGYGEDIISRMSYAAEEADGLETLRSSIVRGIDTLARRAARQAGLRARSITEAVVVGNSVMHHLFLGIDTHALSRAPYVPAAHTSLDLRARDIGLSALDEGAYVHLLPLTASFVGADNMGVLLAEEPHRQDEVRLIVDVGTNAELVLGNRERLICTSTPTGPAFEGAHIEHGMRAADGAIERVQIDPETLAPRFKVIGADVWSDAPDAPPAHGICGSGIIDAVAELYRVGIVGPDGKFDPAIESPYVDFSGDQPVYRLASGAREGERPIPISQEDVRQIQLAKAPLYVAAQYLLKAFGVEQPDRITLAGGFGTHIDPKAAMLLGMIPDCPLDRVEAVGNAAGDGARIALLNRDKRAEALGLLKRVERVELPAQAGFQDQFMLALNFPHMVDPFPHLEGIAPPRKVDPVVRQLYGDEIPEI